MFLYGMMKFSAAALVSTAIACSMTCLVLKVVDEPERSNPLPHAHMYLKDASGNKHWTRGTEYPPVDQRQLLSQ